MGELKDLERNSAEETLNELLNHKVDELGNALMISTVDISTKQ